MKEKYLLAMMDMLFRFAETSEAKRLKVAAMIVKRGSILSIGINGTYPGWVSNTCEGSDGLTLPEVRHAEQACLDQMLQSNETTTDATMLITHACCRMCSLKIKAAGIKNVFYREDYRDLSGIEYLMSAGVDVQKI